MMAMGEYSDTILNQISKNHQEVVFLSDMLNNNKNDLTVFLGQAIQDAKEANSLAQEAVENSKKASDDAKVAYEKSVTAMDNSVVAEDNMLNARRIIQGEEKKVPKSPNLDDIIPEFDTYEPPAILGDKSAETKKADDAEAKEVDKSKDSDKADVKETVKESKKTKTKESSKTKIGKKAQAENMPSFKFDMGNASPGNNNEKILKLHNQGKSNVAIAKELGLGVGEVKLVIDLFK